MTQLWTILNGAGEVVQPCCVTPDAATSPEECGEPWETGYQAIPIDGAPDLNRMVWDGAAWKLSPQVARDMRWEDAKDHSEVRAAAGFSLPGVGTIQTDGASREAIGLLVDEARDRIAAGEPGWTTAFINEANEAVPVTAAQILAIYSAVRAYLGACYAARQAARVALDAALAGGATGEEILAIDITAGYPA